ncbi:hypothetical protein [Streptomyces sp. NPDC001675]
MHQAQHPQQQAGWGAPAPQPPKKPSTGKKVGLGCLGIFALFVVGGIASGSSDDTGDGKSDKSATADSGKDNLKPHKPKPSATPSVDWSAAEKAAGIPPKPTGAKRAQLLHDLSAVNPDIVKYDDKAIDAARNQCSAINGGGGRLDWSASQRFTYRDVTTTEAQGNQINEVLKSSGFCKL